MGADTFNTSAQQCTHTLRPGREEKGGTAKGHQKAAAAKDMAGKAKVMAARDGATAKIRKAEEREFMAKTLWDQKHGLRG